MINGSFRPHDEFLTSLTGEQFIDFRQEDMKILSNSRSSHIEPHTPMTTFTGHTKSTATSESQTALTNFKRGTKRDASAYPIFKNDLYSDIFQRSFLATIKTQGLYDVVDPDFDPDDGDFYEQELLKKHFFVYSVLVTSVQTQEEITSQGIWKRCKIHPFQSFIFTMVIWFGTFLEWGKLQMDRGPHRCRR